MSFTPIRAMTVSQANALKGDFSFMVAEYSPPSNPEGEWTNRAVKIDDGYETLNLGEAVTVAHQTERNRLIPAAYTRVHVGIGEECFHVVADGYDIVRAEDVFAVFYDGRHLTACSTWGEASDYIGECKTADAKNEPHQVRS